VNYYCYIRTAFCQIVQFSPPIYISPTLYSFFPKQLTASPL